MIASAIALSLGAGNVLADSWTIIQEATLHAGPATLKQINGTTYSTQAINSINLNKSNGKALSGSSQKVITSRNVKLRQRGSTAYSNQAINRISADQVGDNTGEFTQSLIVNANKTIRLDQDGAGNNNIQAVHDADANRVKDLSQNINLSGASTIHFEQGFTSATGTKNVQAGSRVKATTVTKLRQAITGSNTTLDFDQANSATKDIQAGNVIDARESGASLSTADGNVTQKINVNTVDMLQEDTGKSIQAGNALITASGATGGKIKQTFKVGTLTMVQDNANGSHQAGNYVGDKIW